MQNNLASNAHSDEAEHVFNRQQVLEELRSHLTLSAHLLGVACGAGLPARYSLQGGADLILVLNSGRFRQMGIGSLAGFLPFANSNHMVMAFGEQEILPLASKLPIVFGLCATDPTIDVSSYLDTIKAKGFSGVVNYPTVGLIDGHFREALEEANLGYDKEVEAIALAHRKDIFTIAFVFNPEQADTMLAAGADIICAHLGLTKGGALGAKEVLPLEAGAAIARGVFAACDRNGSNVMKMVYGGPVNSHIDVQYIYENTTAHGYIGGSSFDRIPSENAIMTATKNFKVSGTFKQNPDLTARLERMAERNDYIAKVKEYVAANYMHDISFAKAAQSVHLSRTHLSALFKKEVGCTFPQYLTRTRVNKAKAIMRQPHISLVEVATLSGYSDYAHFSKAFKRQTGLTPRDYRKGQKDIKTGF